MTTFVPQLRAVRPSDAEALARLFNLPGVRAGTLRMPFSSPEQVLERLKSIKPGSTYLVAEVDGAIVGAASLYPVGGGRLAHVASLFLIVDDAMTGRGIGRAMLDALLDVADNWAGYRRVELEAYADNARAIRLYESAGFVLEGRKVKSSLTNGVFLDSVMMARLRF